MRTDRIYTLEHISDATEPIFELDRGGMLGWLDENDEGEVRSPLERLDDIDTEFEECNFEYCVTMGNYSITTTREDMPIREMLDKLIMYFHDKVNELKDENDIYDIYDKNNEAFLEKYDELDDMRGLLNELWREATY